MKGENAMDRQTAKFLAVVVENMPDMTPTTMQHWIDTGNRHALQAILRRAFYFPIWKTIKMGSPLTPEGLRKALKNSGIFDGFVDELIDNLNFALSKSKKAIDLAIISNAGLGFGNGATLKQAIDRASEFGYKMLTPEAGLHLRLQYDQQPMGEKLFVLFDPKIRRDFSNLGLLVLENGGNLGLKIQGELTSAFDGVWPADTQFIFEIHKKLT